MSDLYSSCHDIDFVINFKYIFYDFMIIYCYAMIFMKVLYLLHIYLLASLSKFYIKFIRFMTASLYALHIAYYC